MKKMMWIVVVWLTCFACAFAESAADDSTGHDDTRIFHVYDDVDLISTIKFQYGRPRIIIKSVFPQLESDTDRQGITNFNQLVLNVVNTKITEYKQQVASNQDLQKKIPKEQLKNDLYVDYDTSFVQSGKHPIISIRFSVQGYIGGMAHPYHHHVVLNYDLENDKSIELSDLFIPESNYLAVLSEYTRGMLAKRLTNANLLEDGTAPTPANFKNWNIKPNGLLITFDEAQVAPYVEGAQTVLVPYSVLKKIVAHDAPIASCVTNKRRCSRSNLLTGGFIDEANRTSVKSSHMAAKAKRPVMEKMPPLALR